MLINVKMLRIVGILTCISMFITTLVEFENNNKKVLRGVVQYVMESCQ